MLTDHSSNCHSEVGNLHSPDVHLYICGGTNQQLGPLRFSPRPGSSFCLLDLCKWFGQVF